MSFLVMELKVWWKVVKLSDGVVILGGDGFNLMTIVKLIVILWFWRCMYGEINDGYVTNWLVDNEKINLKVDFVSTI